MRTRALRAAPMLALAASLFAACSGSGDSGGSGGSAGVTGQSAADPSSASFAAEVATSDLFAGAPQRIQVGVFGTSSDGTTILTFGQVQLGFAFLGQDGSGQPAQGPVTTATYVPAPGTPKRSGAPSLSVPSEARGVYQANDVTFDQAGIWTVEVTAEIPGAGTQRLQAAFQVAEEPTLPIPGDEALRTQNLTTASTDAPREAIDSRARDGAPIPDRRLHRTTVAEAIAKGRPVLVLFATPLYCTSRFCGPTVDGLEALSKAYPRLAEYIHVEIWRDYRASVINRAAADWLWPDRTNDLTEPWLYLIGADGRVVDRWSPLFDPDEVAAELASLPGAGA